MMSDDQAKLFNSLRASTVELLGYDVDNLTAAQRIRVDRVIALRLVIDDAQAKQMRGESIDVRAFVSASEDLERMVGGNPASPPTEARFSVDARARLRRLIEKTLLGGEEIVDESQEALERQFRDHDAREREERLFNHPDEARAALEAEIAAARAKRGNIANPTGGDVKVNSDAARPSPAPAPAGGVPTLVEPPPPPLTDIEKMAKVNSVPALPPRGEREPWRGHVPKFEDGGLLSGGGGSPWSR
jgi:hypothetical protein